MTELNTAVAGIDTSKATLDIAVHEAPESWQVPNTADGWRQLAERLAGHGVGHVGIEASGGYERGVIAHLRAAGVRVSLHQPVADQGVRPDAAAPRPRTTASTPG